jgi:hypothetical protein
MAASYEISGPDYRTNADHNPAYEAPAGGGENERLEAFRHEHI